jgi:hypothetical protein
MKKDEWELIFQSIKDPNGNKIEIPIGGSLGLLALGDVGVMAWKKRKEHVMQRQIAAILEAKKKNQANEK